MTHPLIVNHISAFCQIKIHRAIRRGRFDGNAIRISSEIAGETVKRHTEE